MNAFAIRQAELQAIALIIGLCAGLMIVLTGALVLWMRYGDVNPPFISLSAKALDLSGVERYTYRAGEALELRRDFCVERDIPVQIGRTLRNVETLTGIHVDSTHQMMRSGCRESGNVIQIPPFTPPGRYRYDVSVRWSNNVLHDAAIEWPSVYIDVVR